MRLPADLSPESVTAIIDTREQLPLDLSPLRTIVATLDIGDYSIRGAESLVRIERKSEGDFLSCCGQERERFEREIERLRGFQHRALIVESTWQRIEQGNWRSKITSSQALGSLIGWAAAGIPIFMVGDHTRAGKFASRFLYCVARRHYRDCRTLLAALPEMESANA